MTKWVLIFVIYLGNAGGPATAEFDDQDACRAAIEAILAKRPYQPFAICVPKGTNRLP